MLSLPVSYKHGKWKLWLGSPSKTGQNPGGDWNPGKEDLYRSNLYHAPQKTNMAGWQIPVFNNRRIHVHSWLGDFQPVILVYRGPVSLPVIPPLAFVGHPEKGHPPGPALLKRCLTTPFTTFLCRRQMGGGVEAWSKLKSSKTSHGLFCHVLPTDGNLFFFVS